MDKFINHIIHGDCLEVMPQILDKSIDMILTDPPYPREYQYTYKYLADECPRIMKDGASLIMLVGHYAIPDICEIFKDKLKYRWMFCMNQFDGIHPRMAMGIEIMWKPCLWYVKKAYPQGRGFIRDGFIVQGNSGQKKELHKWEQDLSWANFFIEKLTNKTDIILDPFSGSGTTAIACINTNRNYICIEKELKYVELSRKRVAEHTKQIPLFKEAM